MSDRRERPYVELMTAVVTLAVVAVQIVPEWRMKYYVAVVQAKYENLRRWQRWPVIHKPHS